MRKLLLTALVVAASCCAQSTLRQYLQLTDAEAAAIQNLNRTYENAWFVQQDRVETLNRELTALLAANAPDPAELGKRAVELETIRRDRAARQTGVQKQIAAQLTPIATALVQNLISASTLQPLVNDAACANLLPFRSFQWFNTAAFAFSGALKDPLYSPPGLPYIPPAPTGAFCGSPVFPISVREYLGLTDPQIAVLFAASATYNDFYGRQQDRLTAIKLAIEDLTAIQNADPTAIGLLYAERARIGQQITAKSAQLRDAALFQLTPAQSAQVTTLQNAENLLNANFVNGAIGCNLLTLPAGSSFDAFTIPGNFSFCNL